MIQGKESKPPPIFKAAIPQAPHLTGRGACSDCHVPAIIAGEGDLKICPRCYAVLWRRDYMAEERRKRLEAAKLAAEAAAFRHREKEAQEKLDREVKLQQETKE